MAAITIDFNRTDGIIKPMHAVNNGPLPRKGMQVCDNYESYKAAGIPIMRNHDASFCDSYGGEHSVDVHVIFPDFEADPDDPESYDFQLTDEYIETCLSAGTKIFYRLGSKIEHTSKKYGTLVPKDFHKWAAVCEHIVRHMNEGWADGHRFGIEYWEIWNEPDLTDVQTGVSDCWSGTEEQFCKMFEITAKHLKSCFPNLKIGGPAVAGFAGWTEKFLEYVRSHSVPLDFFSWHFYTANPDELAGMCDFRRNQLDSFGFTGTESILNEYNFILNWDTRFVESVEAIISMKGAAFTASCMLACQQKPLDMLMYYDARPCKFNGLWDFYTQKELKCYWVFVMFSSLFRLSEAVPVMFSDSSPVKCSAARSKIKTAFMLSYFSGSPSDRPETVTVSVPGWKSSEASVTYLDESRTMEKRQMPVKNETLTLTLNPNTVLYIEN